MNTNMPALRSASDDLVSVGYGFEQSGKSARILIDTIYTDKIGAPLRELSANAYDSHVMAGVPLKPFDVHLPHDNEPWFSVRDYGVSLSHEDVMGLYTTLFASTKEDTNAQVGQLGLGSKTPYAYTDSFTVKAWLNGRERTYLANIDQDMPRLTYLGDAPSVFPRGFEVSFSVKPEDFEAFNTKAAEVFRGFDSPPNFIGNIEVEIPQPLFAGNGWKIYQAEMGQGGKAIRMGCVIYPVTSSQLWVDTGLRHDYLFVVDMPIGSVAITANREALSLDPTTSARAVTAFTDAAADVADQMKNQVLRHPTLIQAQREFIAWRRIFSPHSAPDITFDDGTEKVRLNGWVDLTKDLRVPEIRSSKSDAVVDPKFSVESLEELVFIIDKRDRSVPRRAARIRSYRDELGWDFERKMFVIPDADPASIAFLKKRLCLRDDQMIKVDTLPDVQLSASNSTGVKRSGIYEIGSHEIIKVEDDPTGPIYWLPIAKGSDTSLEIGQFGTFEIRWGRAHSVIHSLRESVGPHIADRPLLLLTARAQKRLAVREDSRFDKVIERGLATRTHELIPLAKASGVIRAIPRDSAFEKASGIVWNQLLSSLGIDWTDKNMRRPVLPGHLPQAIRATLDKAIVEGTDAIHQLMPQYPLLFNGKATDAAIRHYIDNITS